MRRLWPLMITALALMTTPALADTTADFEDLTFPDGQAYYNGADGAGGFESRGIEFNNSYNSSFGTWTGFSYSKKTDTTTPGFTNQYSAFTGGGADGSPNYGVAFNSARGDARITFPEPRVVQSIDVTNTTYAGLSMQNGDAFAKEFGGPTGDDPDYFKLTVFGENGAGETTGSVDFYLADYRFEDNSRDYIVDDWNEIDLTSLGSNVTGLEFALNSTDVGDFGMNTPAYFAVDNVTTAPTPSAAGAGLLLLGGLMLRRRKRSA